MCLYSVLLSKEHAKKKKKEKKNTVRCLPLQALHNFHDWTRGEIGTWTGLP